MTERPKDSSGIDRISDGTSPQIVDFAERQVFSPTAKIQAVPAGAPRRSLQRVLCELLDSEINAGLQTFALDIVRVWLGDELNGLEAEAELTPEGAVDDAAIAHWLHETAIKLYPDSGYARSQTR